MGPASSNPVEPKMKSMDGFASREVQEPRQLAPWTAVATAGMAHLHSILPGPYLSDCFLKLRKT